MTELINLIKYTCYTLLGQDDHKNIVALDDHKNIVALDTPAKPIKYLLCVSKCNESSIKELGVVERADTAVICLTYLLDRQKKFDPQWNEMKCSMKDLVFDFDNVPLSCSDQTCFVHHKNATLQPPCLLMPHERLVDENTRKVIPLQQLESAMSEDPEVLECRSRLEAFRKRRIAVYNFILEDIRSYMNQHANTLWMMIWHASAKKALPPELKKEVASIKHFAKERDAELQQLFGTVSECEAFMNEHDMIRFCDLL
jgi:hypothetical protein